MDQTSPLGFLQVSPTRPKVNLKRRRHLALHIPGGGKKDLEREEEEEEEEEGGL